MKENIDVMELGTVPINEEMLTIKSQAEGFIRIEENINEKMKRRRKKVRGTLKT